MGKETDKARSAPSEIGKNKTRSAPSEIGKNKARSAPEKTIKYFGTDGIRGKYGDVEVSEPFFHALGRAVAEYLNEESGGGKIVVGGDTRASTDALKAAFIGGLAEGGATVEDLGILPTPALAYGVTAHGAKMGAMITASHNPYRDNGIKFFDADARKIEDGVQLALEEKLEKFFKGLGGYEPKKFERRGIKVGRFALEEYAGKMLGIFPKDFLKGVKIAMDMANGATSGVSSLVLAGYGAEVVAMGDKPDGFNINEGVGSQHPEKIAALCKEVGADAAFAHDGDGDRVVVCDETGSVLEGEEVLGLIAFDALSRGKLSGNAIVTTIQSNLGMDESLKARGVGVYRSGIGDRLVMREMLARGCSIGGENSGHFIFSEVSPCGDGLAAALSVLSVMASNGKKLSQLRGGIELYPVASKAVPVERKTPIEETAHLSKAVAECEKILGQEGRILVRYSGTEKKIRLLAEGKNRENVDKCMQILCEAVELDLK